MTTTSKWWIKKYVMRTYAGDMYLSGSTPNLCPTKLGQIYKNGWHYVHAIQYFNYWPESKVESRNFVETIINN